MKKQLVASEFTLKETTLSSAHELEKLTVAKNEIEQLEKALIPFDDRNELLTATLEKCRVVNEFIGLKEQITACKSEQDKHELTYVQTKKEYEQLAEDWLRNEAATLAETLHDGEACPVCGSAEHPQKAHRSEAEVTKAQLEAANKQLATIESVYRTAVANYQSIFNQTEVKKKELLHIGIEVENVDVENNRLQAEKKHLEEEIATLREMRSKLVQLKETFTHQSNQADLLMEKKIRNGTSCTGTCGCI